jgi:FKBP-type peptidyl-prolyl cis-trans isomerase
LLCIPLLLTLTTACSAGASDEAAAGEEAAATNDTTSYAIGWQTGQSFVQQSVDVDQESFIQGMRDAIAGKESKFTEEEMIAAMQKLQQDMMARQQAKAQEQAGVNQAAGAEFLATNGARPEVTTLPSGLQYEVITTGDGAKPKATDTVTVNYRGTLIDGSEFDSSYARNTPATFPLNQVIAGWTEGLQLMSVGSKWKLFVPADLAYGLRGSPPKIGPGSTLIFEVELLEIK